MSTSPLPHQAKLAERAPVSPVQEGDGLIVTSARTKVLQARQAGALTPTLLLDLAHTLDGRYHETWQTEYLDERVAALRELVQLTGNDVSGGREGEMGSPAYLLELAHALRDRFLHMGSNDDVALWIDTTRDAVKLTPADSPLYHPVHLSLATALIERHQGTKAKELTDIDEALSYCTSILRLCEQGYSNHHIVLYLLGRIHNLYGFCRTSATEMEQSVTYFRLALEKCPAGDPMRPSILDYLAVTLFVLKRMQGKAAEIEESLGLFQQSLALRPPSHPQRADTMTKLAYTHASHYGELNSSDEDAQKSMDYCQQSLDSLYLTHRDRGSVVTIQAFVANLRSKRRGKLEDLEDAVRYAYDALALTSERDDARGLRLGNLGSILVVRFEILGHREDIDAAISTLREALQMPTNLHIRNATLLDLGEALTCRYRFSGALGDLDEAQELTRQVPHKEVDAKVRDHWRHAAMNLATILMLQFERTNKREELDNAIGLLRSAVEGYTGGGQHRTVLAKALLMRFNRVTHTREDLDEAIGHFRILLDVRTEGHTQRFEGIYGLVDALRARYEAYGAREDYDEAFAMQAEALAALPSKYPHRSRAIFGLSRLLLIPHSPKYDREKAIKLCAEGVSDNGGVTRLRLVEAVDIIEALEGTSKTKPFTEDERRSILQLYRAVMSTAPQAAYFGLDTSSRLQALSKAESVALRAATHALALGETEVAVEVLEEGRGMFWSQGLRLRARFDTLPEALAGRLAMAAHKLEEGTNAIQKANKNKASLEDEVKRIRQLGEEFEALLQDVRALPGMERFLLSEPFDTLKQAANEGPVVVLLAEQNNCSAIIVSATDRPRHVPLSNISIDQLSNLGNSLRDATIRGRSAEEDKQEAGGTVRLAITRHVREIRAASTVTAASVLEMLWTGVMEPVISALGLKPASGRARPRVWLVPTGAFVTLPLHAAGVYNTTTPDIGCSTYALISYTPTITALFNARRDLMPVHIADAKLLVAAVPAPPGQWKELPNTIDELRVVEKLVPAEALISLGAEHAPDEPSVRTVLDRVHEASVLHLACHGQQNHTDAVASGFVLRDSLLRVSDLLALRLPKAFLAVLSACETAKGDAAQPDQAIHLAAAMLFVGFRSVVGTLWSMHDVDGPAIASELYSAIFSEDKEVLDHQSIPYALDEAVRKLREKGLPPSRWASYVHIGL